MLSLCICLSTTGSAQESTPREPRSSRTAATPTPAALLAAEIREIANSPSLSVAKKEKRIATAVRVAVVAATAYKNDAGRNLDQALEFASAASRAAPRFTEVIVNAVSLAPAISRIDGSAGQIRTVAFAAAKAGGRKVRPTTPALVQEYVSTTPPRRTRPAPAEDLPEESPPPTPQTRRPTRSVATANKPRSPTPEADEAPDAARTSSPPPPETVGDYADNTPLEVGGRGGSSQPLSGNSAFHAKADVTIRHDDNVYLSKENKTSDQIVSLTPGVDFSFGQNSLTHGSLGYQVEFLRYVHHSAPSARLNHLLADFGYSSAALSVAATGSYHQAYQNNRDVLVAGNSALIRSNSLNFAVSGEGSLTPKTGLKTGASYTRTEYPVPAALPPPATTPTPLIGNSIFSVPLNLYYKVTPKIDLSAGATYTTVKPQSDGPGGHDIYYNVGARGEFTPKLTGEFSVGYRKRHGENGTDDSLVGYNGAFNYEVTPKTSLTLSLGKDFSTSATGESLHNSSYGLRLGTTFTPQWEAGLSISYRQVDYGLQFFRALPSARPSQRKDNYWEESLSTSYIFSSWLTTTVGYTLRNNSSANNPGVEFSNSLLSLMMSLRY